MLKLSEQGKGLLIMLGTCLLFWVLVGLLVCRLAHCDGCGLPPHEIAILSDVADQYGLTGDARRLLYVIRRVEQGGPGREMGVLVPAAGRYKGNAARSLRLQAEWAAGTIRKRWTGNLAAFAARWCQVGAANDPGNLNQHWLRNASYYMAQG